MIRVKIGLILAFFLLSIAKAFSFYNKNLWPVWQCNNPLSIETINHDPWQVFLNKYLVTNEEGINLIDYDHIEKKDKEALNYYLKTLSQIDICLYRRQEQLAFWINLYNALIVQTIINYYPVNSVEDINISPGLFSIGPWGTKLISINNQPLSLDEIYNRIIRPIWNDMRTHYALNNGTIGAANLSHQAYKGSKIEEQLNEATYQYINSLRGIQIIDDEIVASKILDWYSEDFGETDERKLLHIRQFANPKLKKQLENLKKISHYVYNWHLNKASGVH